ncbi:MAG: hypothetical protein ACYTEZ_08625 [Planctomycetota bacterium]|jgi:hypothetical protein
MTLSEQISAHSLLRASLRAPEGVTRTRAVFPFFTGHLDVRFLLVVLRDGRCVITRDLPQWASGHVLHYPFAPVCDLPLADASLREIGPLFHFDPWWLLRDRSDLPEATRQTAVASNLAGRELAGGTLHTVYFDDGLLSVVAARVARRRLEGDELLDALRGRPSTP